MEDLKRQLDIFNDYATIRIYWKFYEDKRMENSVLKTDKNIDPQKMKRAYLMYIGKTNQIIELDKHDVKTVIDYCSLQIKNNVIV